MRGGELRSAVVRTAREMSARALGRGTSGNVSMRAPEGMVVTPSALPYDAMETDDAVLMALNGEVLEGSRKPTTEWRLHAAVYRARPEVGGIVHTHATFCAALSTLRRDVPAFHYMVAAAGGDSIRCASYATFGSTELAESALVALRDRRACLLANHGMVALGPSPGKALELAEEVEGVAELYWRVLQVGEPALLTEEEMAEALERFTTYR